MEDPQTEIESVVRAVAASPSAKAQRVAFTTYYTHDASFRHPLCSVHPSPGSRELVLRIYQWYRIISPHIDITVDRVTWDKGAGESGVLLCDVRQKFKLRWLPIKPADARLLIRLTLSQPTNSNLYFIKQQEDFYHPDDFIALLFPPLIPVIRFLLLLTGLACNFYAWLWASVKAQFTADDRFE